METYHKVLNISLTIDDPGRECAGELSLPFFDFDLGFFPPAVPARPGTGSPSLPLSLLGGLEPKNGMIQGKMR